MKNQTESAWLEGLETNALGTGIFLVPEVHRDDRAVRKVVVGDITYRQCKRRGKHCVAYKWVPQAITTEAELMSTSCQLQ